MNSTDTSKAKRNAIAIVVGLFAILLIASLTRPAGSDHGFWQWLVSARPPQDKGFIADGARTRLVNLTGKWHFATGDDPERAEENFDHSQWAEIEVPAYWEDRGYKDYNGFAWYRRDFSVNADELDKPLFVLLGRVDDTDEVFINGQRIGGHGQFPPTYVSAWNQQRSYAIPKGLVHEGKNIIAVRVYDAQMGGGITGSNIGIFASNLPQPLVNLQGEWQFRTGDEPEWKNEEIELSGFQTVQVPASWEDQGFVNYDGFGWYRKVFARPEVSADEPLILLLGKIDDTDEVFLNGELIGRTGRLNETDRAENPDYYALDRRYEFSASLLRESNVLAVRIHDSGGYGGIYAGPVGIMTKTAYAKYREQLGESGKWRFDDTVSWLMGKD